MKKSIIIVVLVLMCACVFLSTMIVNVSAAEPAEEIIYSDSISLTQLYYDIEETYPDISHYEILDLMYSYLYETSTYSLVGSVFDIGVNDEEFWVIVFNLWPWQYDTALDVKDRAVAETQRLYGSNNSNNDGDAFRHTYFAALLSYEFGVDFALELTNAHEANTEDPFQLEMDLHNNSRGIQLYKIWNEKFKPASEDEHWSSLSSFLNHCVFYGDVYNILRFDDVSNPTKLIYTSIGNPNEDSFTLPYTKVTLTQHQYGFEQQYFFYEKSLSITTDSGYTIDTKRLRTGYIETEYIVLSPRRAGAGVAYLEYSFLNPIEELDAELALWGFSEYLSSGTSEALIQYKNSSGEWVTVLDLLNDVFLSRDRSEPDLYRIELPEEVYSIRFYVSSLATGDRNRGRVCIGNMTFYLENEEY